MEKGKGKRMLWMLLRVVLLSYAGLLVLAFVLQKKMIFPGGRDMYRTPAFYAWSYDDVVLPVGDETTHGWYIPAEHARGTVLFSHGNAGTIADRLESCGFFREMGFDVLVYDYGGYGKSTGGVSEQRCYADIRAMWRHLTEERGIDSKKIVLFGRSLGGGPTVDLAAEITNAEEAPAAVIIESTFLSAGQVGQDAFPFLPVKWLIRHKFDSAGKIGRVRGPILIIHSPQDDIIPFKHGMGLFELANEPKQFLEIHGGHNEGFVLSDELRRKTIEGFVGPLLK